MGHWLGYLLLSIAFAALLRSAEPVKPPSLAELPAAAQKTVRQQIGPAQITAIDKQTEDGETSYDIDFVRNGEERTLTVADNGMLLSIQLGLPELPAPVRKTVSDQLKGASLDLIEKTFDDDEVTYEVEITRGQTERSFTVGADGKLLRLQIDLAEAPKAVQKTIAAQGGQPGDIFRVFEDKQISYDAEITKNGQDREISVAENGHLESVEVSLDDLPAPARKTVNNRTAGGHIERIDKCFNEKDEVRFEVSGKKDGKRFDFKVGPRGRFFGMNK